MTNKGHSSQHGLSTMNETRPKSKNSKKAAKVRARVKSAERMDAIKEAKKAHLC